MAKKAVPKPLTTAAMAWLAGARKGESFDYFRGDITRVMMTPEEAMTNEQRRQHSITCQRIRVANKRDGGKRRPPPIPDRWRLVRPDLTDLLEIVDRAEVRGLVTLSVTVIGKADRIYTMTCAIQRNGLAAVRERK